MAVCWLCGRNPEGPPVRAQKVTLYRGAAERTVSVPTCISCADVIDRGLTWGGSFALLGLAGGIALGIVVGSWPLGIGVFVLGCLLGGLAAWVVRHRGGIRNRVNTYPEIRRMKQDGWTSTKPPQQQPGTGFGVSKTCSHCGKAIASSARPGQHCPHCGVYWSYEQDRTRR